MNYPVYAWGIDISEWDDVDIDFEGAQFVMIRCSYGTIADTKWEAFTKRCEESGIPYGYYVYDYALSEAEAIDEAKFALELTKDYHPQMYAFDYEYDTYKADNGVLTMENGTAWSTAFCKVIEDAGFASCVYTNPDFLENYIHPTGKIWLADWNGIGGDLEGAGAFLNQVIMHQWSGAPLDRDALVSKYYFPEAIEIQDKKAGDALEKQTQKEDSKQQEIEKVTANKASEEKQIQTVKDFLSYVLNFIKTHNI